MATGDHLDDAYAEAVGADQGASAEGAVGESDGFIPRELWVPAWLQMHGLAGNLLRLETLTTAPQKDGAMLAAEAIYDSIKDTPVLHFLIRPDTVWMQRAIVIGAFYLPVLQGCQEELRARRAKPVNDPPKAPATPPQSPVVDTVAA